MTCLTRPRFLWQLRTRTLPLGERTLLMAIVNLTPDSFSGDGHLAHATPDVALERAVTAACAALDSGADVIDLGAESTRPGATPLSPAEEQARLLPVLRAVLHLRPAAILSVDTYHAATARAAIHHGAEIVNDVSGLQWDPAMASTVAGLGCGLVLMHTRGRPGQWRSLPAQDRASLLGNITDGLQSRLAQAATAGIPAGHIVIDPGFGFGKQGQENFTLLAELATLHSLQKPLLIGLSRKGFLGEAVRSCQPAASAAAPPAKSRRAATLAANVAAILAGAHLLRVHDVQLTREAAAVADTLLHASVTPQARAL